MHIHQFVYINKRANPLWISSRILKVEFMFKVIIEIIILGMFERLSKH
jgi:hypothetical protein